MNLLLIEPAELSADGEHARVGAGRRLEHVRRVLRAAPGDELRAGVIGGRLGRARLLAIDADHLELALELDREPAPLLPVTLILALPRPKVLRRLLSAAAALGVRRLFLVHARRVEKSYWQSPHLTPPAMRRALLSGLEQAGATTLPQVELWRRFRPFAEDELPGQAAGTTALVAHPAAEQVCPRRIAGPLSLAVGPEGGWLPYEVAKLGEAGFAAVTLGDRVLRVEDVVPWLMGRLS